MDWETAIRAHIISSTSTGKKNHDPVDFLRRVVAE
jgi:hypothetical protein